MVNIKQRPISLTVQAGILKNYFPDSSVTTTPSSLTWKASLVPTSLSSAYEVKLVYKLGKNPDVFVTAPKLALAEGKKHLPHVYSTKNQWLCLYYRKAREWQASMPIADTIVPWTSEWLFFYEIWQASGLWTGGGIEHGSQSEQQKVKTGL